MSGDKKGGFTIFWADDGLDTGAFFSVPPILQARGVLYGYERSLVSVD